MADDWTSAIAEAGDKQVNFRIRPVAAARSSELSGNFVREAEVHRTFASGPSAGIEDPELVAP